MVNKGWMERGLVEEEEEEEEGEERSQRTV